MLQIKSIAVCISLLLVLSCLGQNPSNPDYQIDFTSALETYNKSRSETDHEGIAIDGAIQIEKIINEEQKTLVFLVSGAVGTYRKYRFQYDADQVAADLPAFIRNGKSIYLGDNLIIVDKEKQKNYAFLVESYENRIPELSPRVGNGLASAIFDNKTALLSSAGTCTCDCQSCGFNCDVNCGNAEKTCTCPGGGGESVKCRNCYNAVCTQCPKQ